MPQRLLELVAKGDLDAFEAQCLELLEVGQVPLAALAECFRRMEKSPHAERVLTLAQMVLENIDLESDPRGALAVVAAALNALPGAEDLRRITTELYTRVYGQTPGFAAILQSSGLTTHGSARTALRVLDFCLQLTVGDTLISRLEDRVVEVVEVDRERGLFTLRRGERLTTLAAREVVREYERIDADDFRVLRQLRPERLAELIHSDPVALVTGLLHAHGEHLDADQLKHELVPKYIDAKSWSKWWGRTRTLLKRAPHIIVEGRTPVVLTYTAAGRTLEEEVWDTFAARADPADWLNTLGGYLREQKAQKQPPDAALLTRVRDHILKHIGAVRARRPAEALAAALVLRWLGEQGVALDEDARTRAREKLQSAQRPSDLIAALDSPVLRDLALTLLPEARPNDWVDQVAALLPTAPAAELDRLVNDLRHAGRLETVQQAIDDALADPVDYPEIVFWLWKGPEDPAGLKVLGDTELLELILTTLGALGVTLNPSAETVRHFRARIKAALALRDYTRVHTTLQQTSPEAAVPLRRRIDRLTGVGENARRKLLDLLRATHPGLWVTPERRLAPWEDPDVSWATQAGLTKKTAEHDELVNVKMRDNARRIGEAASHGDLSENSEYRFALEERDFLRARLAQINRELSLARLLTPQDVPTDHVGIGTRVTLRDVADASERQMTVLGPFETDIERGIYSYKAPICQKLMGLHIGERTRLTIEGAEREFEIVALENGLHASRLVPDLPG